MMDTGALNGHIFKTAEYRPQTAGTKQPINPGLDQTAGGAIKTHNSGPNQAVTAVSRHDMFWGPGRGHMSPRLMGIGSILQRGDFKDV